MSNKYIYSVNELGNVHGRYEMYYTRKPTQLLCVRNYDNGVLHGFHKEYNIDGYVQYNANYVNGSLDNEECYYYDNGNVHVRNIYNNGVLVSRSVHYESGEISEVINY